MAKYAFTAVDEKGNEQFGVLEAPSEEAAIKEVRSKGLLVTEVREAWVADELRASFSERLEQGRQRREEELARQQRALRKKHPRQRLVVRYRDGGVKYGICYALNPRQDSFYLDCVDSRGQPTEERLQVRFSDLKAVFHVRSFDGKHGRDEPHQVFEPEGEELYVEFEDKEVIHGRALARYNPQEPRFQLVPKDPRSNNLNVLIERAAIKGVYTPEQYRAKLEEERRAQRAEPGAAAMSQEESLGDFYFDSRNYPAALAEYEKAAKRFPDSRRIRKKIIYAEFNIGVQHIKRRDYVDALSVMERVLKSDPTNAHAKKKVAQLRRIIAKGGARDTKEVTGGQIQDLD